MLVLIPPLLLPAPERAVRSAPPHPLAQVPHDDKLRIVVPERKDATEISSLLAAATPDCLPQSETEILDRLHQFEVARYRWRGVVASAAVRPLDRQRAELRGLAVSPTCRGRGIGRILVERAVLRAQGAGLALVCVTRRPRFFRSLGFREIPLDSIPKKKRCPCATAQERPRVAMEWRG